MGEQDAFEVAREEVQRSRDEYETLRTDLNRHRSEPHKQ